MRLLLDENLPKRLKQDLQEHEIYTVADKGWTGISNGKLLELLVANNFDALLTFDKNLQYQQNLVKYPIPVIIVTATDNTYFTLKGMVPRLKSLLKNKLKPGPTEIS